MLLLHVCRQGGGLRLRLRTRRRASVLLRHGLLLLQCGRCGDGSRRLLLPRELLLPPGLQHLARPQEAHHSVDQLGPEVGQVAGRQAGQQGEHRLLHRRQPDGHLHGVGRVIIAPGAPAEALQPEEHLTGREEGRVGGETFIRISVVLLWRGALLPASGRGCCRN